MLKTAFFVKHQLTATKTKFDGDTQKLRRELIIDLLFLKEYTSRRSNDRRLSDKNRIKWMQVTAEITRAISYISKDLDTLDNKERIEKLQKILEKF
ncbi:MAG: hypothetical protein ACOWW1_02300 [archaeon]|nr:hypothetical protein [Candidatus Bathyarchaeum sp.]